MSAFPDYEEVHFPWPVELGLPSIDLTSDEELLETTEIFSQLHASSLDGLRTVRAMQALPTAERVPEGEG